MSSWFGETFGDSLTSLKGQISKITKEVLAEDDDPNENEPDAVNSQIKELGALCSSKDLEITSLREENRKIIKQFQEEVKLLKNENKELKAVSKKGNEGINFFGGDQNHQVNELQNQLQQMRIERDHLEELQRDHQSNLCLVLQQKDNYKRELEKVKEEYLHLQSNHNDLLNKQNGSTAFSDMNEIDLKENEDIVNLRNIVEELQIQIESYQNEKEETSKVIERHILNSENLKENTEKLSVEIKVLNSEKENVELENQRLKGSVETLQNELSKKVDDLKFEQKKKLEVEEKLNCLSQMMGVNKVEQSNMTTDLEIKVKELMAVLNIKVPDQIAHGNSLLELINLIKNSVTNRLREKENAEEVYNQKLHSLEDEIQKVKGENMLFKNDIKIQAEKWNEMECNYKDEINSLQSKYLELKSQEQDCIIKSQTDDVKRLEQEVLRLSEIVEAKGKELSECNGKIKTDLQELTAVRSLSENLQHQLTSVTAEKEKLDEIITGLRSELDNKEREMVENSESKRKLEETCKHLEGEKLKLSQDVESLRGKLTDASKEKNDLLDNVKTLKKFAERVAPLEKELDEAIKSKMELESACAEMQRTKPDVEHQMQDLKAQLIVKESKLMETVNSNKALTDEISKLRDDSAKLKTIEEELNRWKETMVDLEVQRQDLAEQKEKLEAECTQLKAQLATARENAPRKDAEFQDANATVGCSEATGEPQTALQTGEVQGSIIDNGDIVNLQKECEQLRVIGQQQANIVAALTYENNELKRHLQMYNERMMAQTAENDMLSQENKCTSNEGPSSGERGKEKVQQHRRSRSAADSVISDATENAELVSELTKLKESSQKQMQMYRALQEDYAKISEKESRSRKELERLRVHLIEIETDYTETIDEYKTKLSATEEQLKNSSTFYTSNKVRDNQHLESLQGQMRLIAAQRDDLQVKLSAAEDEVQRHEAALTSFRVVLEQFQQDKERELESVATKYENQIVLSERRFAELQGEVSSLTNQLSDAKNGLKAASRLGEQLDRKSQQILDLEGKMSELKNAAKESEERAALAHQSSSGKIDKSLVKNLVLGYLSCQQPDRRAQVLRIMSSVLDFDQDERNKIGLDSNQSGWLSNLLHPKSGDQTESSQSLSEAFIRFLENESRPQPQMKLLHERPAQAPSTPATPKPSLLLQELVLPTFNSPQGNESTILKDVLKDS